MTEPLPEYKRTALEQQRSALLEEYTAANRQLNATLSAADRTKIERQIANLEEQIQKIEERLGRGTAQTGQAAEPPVTETTTPPPALLPPTATAGTTSQNQPPVPSKRGLLGWFHQLSDGSKAAVIVAVITGIFTVVVALISLLGDVIPPSNGPGPTPSSLTYVVRVEGQSSADSGLADARVTLEVPGRAPLDAFTDSNGVAAITVPAQYVGGSAVLLVEAAGFAPLRQNITLDSSMLPPLVRLMPAQQP